MSGTILIAYGSKHGSTQEVAHAVAEELQEHGLDVETLPAREVDDLRPYAAVVVGGSIYMGRWHADALDLLKRHKYALEPLPRRRLRHGPEDARAARRRAARWRSSDRSLAKRPRGRAGRRRRSSAASSTRARSASRSAACRRATPATGRRSGPGPRVSPCFSTTGNPHRIRGISAASFSRRPDERRRLARKLVPQRSELERKRLGRDGKEFEMRKVFEIGGIVAAAVLVAFGIASIVMGINGRSTVRDSLKLEQIVGSPDMTPAAIKAEAQAGRPAGQRSTLPTMDVAGKPINTGARARAFASYMRIHTLEATGNLTYSQMGRFIAKPGTPAKFTDGHGGTSIDTYAAHRPEDAAARRQRAPQPLGHRDGADHGAQHELHGRAALALRHRRRLRAPARRDRLRDPRDRRRAPQPGHARSPSPTGRRSPPRTVVPTA